MVKVLIVENDPQLGRSWALALKADDIDVQHACNQPEAITALRTEIYDVIILDLLLPDGDAMAVSDFASYRQPNARVIFVSNSDAFSDGSIFTVSQNASAFLQTDLPPEDLAAIVQYHASPR